MHDFGSREWTDLCEWFEAKAKTAIQEAGDEKAKAHVMDTLAAFHRETPPKSAEALEMWREIAEIHVSEWEDGRFNSVEEFPVNPSLDRILRKLSASTKKKVRSRNR